MSTSLVLAIASIAALMAFIHHMAQSLRVVTVTEQITAETVRSLDHLYGDEPRTRRRTPMAPVANDGSWRVIASPRTAVVTWYDHNGLTGTATEHDCTVELLVAPGTYVVTGQPLLRVTGASDLDADAVLPHLTFGSERALSPGINDATTAVQCIDRLHGLQRRIATRDLAVGQRGSSSCSPPAVGRRCRTASGQPPWVRVTRASVPPPRGWIPAVRRAIRAVRRPMHERPVIRDTSRSLVPTDPRTPAVRADSR